MEVDKTISQLVVNPQPDQSISTTEVPSKRYILPIITFVILVTIIIVGAYYLKVQSPNSNSSANKTLSVSPTPSSSTATKIISLATAWNLGTDTYSNPNIDITLKYPSSFIKKEQDTTMIQKMNEEFKQQNPNIADKYGVPYPDELLTFSFRTPEAPIEERKKPGFDWKSYQESLMVIGIDVSNNVNNISLDDFLKKHYQQLGMDLKTSRYDALKKNLKLTNTPTPNSYILIGDAAKESLFRAVFFSYKNKFYTITLGVGDGVGQPSTPEAEKIFDQVIESITLK